MAVYFKTGMPNDLLKAFNDRIDQEEPKGQVRTWRKFKKDGNTYYTHTSDEWANKAYFKPVVGDGVLRFNIIKNADFDVSIVAYGYYHGHLTETFLNHFDEKFSEAASSAIARDGDIVKSNKTSSTAQ
jgi:hypothetical protein